MVRTGIRQSLSFRLLLFMLMGTIILYLGIGFVRQASVSRQRRAELRQIEQALAVTQERNARLLEYLAYVQTPEAAERWAHENSWALENEVSVVVLPSGIESIESSPGVPPDGQPRPGPTREAWWDLFFGQR
jgi:hypothetical protein